MAGWPQNEFLRSPVYSGRARRHCGPKMSPSPGRGMEVALLEEELLERTIWVRNLLNQDGREGMREPESGKTWSCFPPFSFNIYLVVWVLVVTHGVSLMSWGVFHCGAWIL